MILKIFMKLILNCHHTLWHHFMADFELVVKSSLQFIFSDILQWHGCYPHFGQAIQRKIQSVGLITEYRDRASLFSIFVRKLRCLAFLPLDLVRDGFEQLRGEYVDPINLVLGQERAPLIAEFMT